MKPIKFDLPLNGIKIANLEQLKSNLGAEILEPFRSGRLVKWFQVRSLNEQAKAIEMLLVSDIEDEVQLLKKLYEIFDCEIDDDDAIESITDYQISLSSNQNLSEQQQNYLASNKNYKVRLKLTENLSIDTSLQFKLANDEDVFVRRALAKNPLLDVVTQFKLASDKDFCVRRDLAQNPSLAVVTQFKLANDVDSHVREALAQNPAIDITVQSKLTDNKSETSAVDSSDSTFPSLHTKPIAWTVFGKLEEILNS